MADRILIGKHNGGMTLRISKPGYDVKNAANPMIFSSDNDYLRVHHRNKLRMNRNSTADYYFYTAYDSFPPLPYYPLVWLHGSNTGGLGAEVKYPSGEFRSVSDYTNCVVGKNGIWFENWIWKDQGNIHFDVEFIIFKNRII
jgi:hypothetical protein